MHFGISSTKNRSKRAAQNIGISLLIKGGSILISFLLVPMTLDYLNPYEYGIWLTLNSILSWIYLFDIGLGNGLRNKLSEAIAQNDYKLGRIYVSTTYFCMSIIVAAIFLLFLVAQNWLQWDKILNVDPSKVANLNSIVTILFCFFCLSFVFRLLGNIFLAKQLSFANDFLAFMGNAVALVAIYVCTHVAPSSLLLVSCILGGIPLVVYIVATPIVFHRYKSIAPSIKFINLKYFHNLISLGVKFMLIQVCALVLYMTSNVIISQLFGPEEVTPYNIAYKLFSVVTMAFGIIVTPFWSAITDAYTKEDYTWIKKSVKQLIIIWLVFVAGTILLIFLSPYIYKIWIGEVVNIPLSLSIAFACYVSLYSWCNIWAFILNGTGKLQIQIILSVVQALMFIPLAIFLGKTFGVVGIVQSLCCCMVIGSVIAPIQYFKIINFKATGIWDR